MKWLLIILSLTIASCAAVIKESKEGAKGAIDNMVAGELSSGLVNLVDAPAIGMFRGEPYILMYNARGELIYKRGNEEQIISKDGPSNANLTHIVTYADAIGIYVLWRPKLAGKVEGVGEGGDKLIVFRASYDGKTFGKTQRLNDKGGAFMPRVTGNGKGDIYVAWVDERNGGGKYDIYMNISHDSGRTWKEKDLRIDIGEPGSSASTDPTIVAEDDKVWVAWREGMSKEEPSNLYARFSSDRGEKWDEPVLIVKEEESSTGLTLIKKGKAIILYGFDLQGLKLSYSEDGGRSWKVNKPEGMESVGEIRVLNTPDKVYLITGIMPDGKKEDIFIFASEDGINFGKPIRLDTNTPYYFTSTWPEAAVDGMGNILVAWHDFRNFRSNIYFNYSTDKGQTWQKQDLIISEKGMRQQYWPKIAADDKGSFYVLWVGYMDDMLEKSGLYMSTIDIHKISPAAQNVRGEKKLRERVSQFWGDRILSNWGGNYDLLDPYFRQRTSREYYIANQLKTIYYSFEIKDIKITDNMASVTIKYTHEVPEFISPQGKKLKVPKRDEEITEVWIWIDGDWFRVFKDVKGGSFVAY